MRVLVTGATGNVGTVLVHELRERGVDVRILTRKKPQEGIFPDEVEVAVGDLLDPKSATDAMEGVDKLFLLNAVSPSELTEALIAYGVAKRIGIKHLTYLSAFKADVMKEVPHMASKYAVEGALHHGSVPFTILRPNYFIQNDARLKPVITGMGLYPVPLGEQGVSAVDIRDIAEAAAISLTEGGHLGQTYDLVGPSVISGPSNAELWSKLIQKAVRYGGHDLERWEGQVGGQMPHWMAFDFRSMFKGFLTHGYAATEREVARLTNVLGHPPRSYDAFATQAALEWKR